MKCDKGCLEHELGRLFRESNHGHGEIAIETMQSLRETKMEDFVYIHNQLHISHCLTGPSLRDMKMREFCSKG
jgi:hypothetical protein